MGFFKKRISSKMSFKAEQQKKESNSTSDLATSTRSVNRSVQDPELAEPIVAEEAKIPKPNKKYSYVENDDKRREEHVILDPDSPDELVELVNVKVERLMLLQVPSLTNLLPEFRENVPNIRKQLSDVLGSKVEYENYMDHENVILADIVRNNTMQNVCRAYVRAGPRRTLYFSPPKVVAAIVTCGGLCPGLNNVVREIVRSLQDLYGVEKVYGFRGGYGGIYTLEPILLDVDKVANIHHMGGTVLSSSRGGFDVEKILDKLDELGINQLYCIGGDGTMRGARKLHTTAVDRCKTQGRNRVISVAGIPKTIDNDICEIDRSFGFFTAVEEAVSAIKSAKTEAKCLINGVGIVKLMGRSAGFIAAHAALASGDCDLCLVPEVPIVIEGQQSVLDHVVRVVKKKGHAVVVVAEGAGEELLGQSTETDASGNRKLPAIGYWFKKRLEDHFKCQSPSMDASVKYIDPSYMIRSVPANANDSTFCMLLAQNAVHGAMAGYSGFCTGLCNDRLVYLPMKYIVEHSPRHMNPNGRTWERILSMTQQPTDILR